MTINQIILEYDAASETQKLEKDGSRGRSRTPAIGGEWPCGLRQCIHIGRIPGQTP